MRIASGFFMFYDAFSFGSNTIAKIEIFWQKTKFYGLFCIFVAES